MKKTGRKYRRTDANILQYIGKTGRNRQKWKRGRKLVEELVQSILVYVVIVSVLRGLITNPKYSQYFQFFSGMVMILLLLTPILSVFQYENQWYELLEEKLLQMDLTQIEGEMEIAQDQFADMVAEEYQETAVEQIKKMAEQKGVQVEDAAVTLHRDEDAWEIAEITVTSAAADGGELTLETAVMDEKKQLKEEDTSKTAKALREQICSSFVIGEDKVHIWKEKGKK
jgi:hypothetical protein